MSENSSAASAPIPAVALDLGNRFAAAGYELALVGGWVRDAILRRGEADLDFTTNATRSEEHTSELQSH